MAGNSPPVAWLPAWLQDRTIPNLLTTPVIYALLVPFVCLDVGVSLFQWTCFPVYGIARVPRGRYFVMDRHRLRYLSLVGRANCAFCSYANGVLSYVREVAARTEQYWCPIRHRRRVPAPHRLYRRFFRYGDARAYDAGWWTMRARLRAGEPLVRPWGRAKRPGRRRRAPQSHAPG